MGTSRKQQALQALFDHGKRRREMEVTRDEGTLRIGLMRNLGPASERMLAEIGIRTGADLRAIGSTAAYRRLQFESGRPISRNLLWAMEAALRDCDWRNLPDNIKADLLAKLAR